MPKRIYVGNLPFDITHEQVDSYFRGNAHVVDAPVVEKLKRDRATESARAIVVVEGGEPDAIAASVHGTEIGGRTIACSTDRSVVINHEEQDI